MKRKIENQTEKEAIIQNLVINQYRIDNLTSVKENQPKSSPSQDQKEIEINSIEWPSLEDFSLLEQDLQSFSLDMGLDSNINILDESFISS